MVWIIIGVVVLCALFIGMFLLLGDHDIRWPRKQTRNVITDSIAADHLENVLENMSDRQR